MCEELCREIHVACQMISVHFEGVLVLNGMCAVGLVDVEHTTNLDAAF